MEIISRQIQRNIPKVSVAMVTYNHDKYIAQAIESVLVQATDFQVELVIGEDCSTDGTRAIVKQYADQYPNLIRALFRERNLGAYGNYSNVISTCAGEYIAYLEGDDFWIDPEKLTRQVELLDANPAMSFCFHRVIEFDESQGKECGILPSEDLRDFPDPAEELIRRNFIHSNSQMLRRSMIPVFDREFENLRLGDWPTSIMMALNGKIGFLPQKMAVYRRHSNSTWSSKGKDYRDLETLKMFVYLFKKRFRTYRPSIARSALYYSRLVMTNHRSQGFTPNIALAITSLKVAYGINLFEMLVQVKWLLLHYCASPKRKFV